MARMVFDSKSRKDVQVHTDGEDLYITIEGNTSRLGLNESVAFGNWVHRCIQEMEEKSRKDSSWWRSLFNA